MTKAQKIERNNARITELERMLACPKTYRPNKPDKMPQTIRQVRMGRSTKYRAKKPKIIPTFQAVNDYIVRLIKTGATILDIESDGRVSYLDNDGKHGFFMPAIA